MLNVLIVVDVQPDFCEGGALAVEGGNEVVAAIGRLLHDNQHSYDLVVTTQDWHKPSDDNGGHFSEAPDFVDTWPVHCVAETLGAEIHASVKAELPTNTFHFKKGFGTPSYSGFEARWAGLLLGDFLDSLVEDNGRSIVVDVVGIATSHCVKATALDALKRGYDVAVRTEYCVGVTPELAQTALTEMSEAGISLI